MTTKVGIKCLNDYYNSHIQVCFAGITPVPSGEEGGNTLHQASGTKMPIYDAAMQYKKDGAGKVADVTATGADGKAIKFKAQVLLLTPKEVEYFRHGGILHYVLRQLAASPKTP